MAGTTTVDWNGHRVEAARPEPIRDAGFDLSPATIRRTERAAGAVRRIADRSAGGLDAAARLLLRSEGLASSAIEGLRARAEDVALAEAAADAEAVSGSVAAWVSDNLAVVTASLDEGGPLDERKLLGWHRRLMRHSSGIEARHVGAYRDALGWVGGSSPLSAAHVGAPASMVPGLMEDMIAFVERDDLDPVTQAAVAHAQFETIHPFADGNGRIGRILIGWMLTRGLDVAVPPPVSLQFSRDVAGYQSGLTLFRQDKIDTWVSWFADAVEASGSATLAVFDAVDALRADWRERVAGLRADSAARQLVEELPIHPVVSARSVAELLHVSEQAARTALGELERRGILAEAERVAGRPGRPRRWWVARALLQLVGPNT